MFTRTIAIEAAMDGMAGSLPCAADCGRAGQTICMFASAFPAIQAPGGAAAAFDFGRNGATEPRQIVSGQTAGAMKG